MINKIFIILLFYSISIAQTIDKGYNRIRNDFYNYTPQITDNSRDEEELNDFIQTVMTNNLIPGVSVSIVKNEHIVWQNHFGYANIDENILVNENTLFMLASVSKTITATALMQLFENGLFDIDDDINVYLPFSVSHPDFLNAPITFKMLLSHTSGIKDNWDVMPYYNGDSNLDLGYYLEQYLTIGGEFYGNNSSFTNSMPGSSYNYSNIGAALIGLLVEVISNQTFNSYCNENIFDPLEMHDSFWFLSEIDDLNQIAIPYVSTGGAGYVDDCSGDGDCCLESWIGDGYPDCEDQQWDCDLSCYDNDGDDCEDNGNEAYCGDNFCNGDENYITCPDDCSDNTCSDTFLVEYMHYGYSDYPSGQLRTTSNNLAKFMAAYINNGIYNGTRILETETIELIKSIQYPNINNQQGIIWYYKILNGRNLLGHNGGDVGVSTEMFFSVSDNIGVIILSNASNYNALIDIENAVFDFAEETNFIPIGDLNLDNIVNILDLIYLVNIILGENEFSELADLNGDQQIDILDVIYLLQIILYE